MKYICFEDHIELQDNKEFSAKHILECGQVFRFFEKKDCWFVVSGDKVAKIVEEEEKTTIWCSDPEFFVDYFDLARDYSAIKSKIKQNKKLEKVVSCAEGLRILRQPLFETIVSFIVSANNNIKRIKLILNRLAEKKGTRLGEFYAFPTYEQMKDCDETFFKSIGAGYRSAYLVKFLKQYPQFCKNDFEGLSTAEIYRLLIDLAGVGPKVANCILLFAFSRTDSFPVDTWMEKAYYEFFANKKSDSKLNRNQISKKLVDKFGNLSGFVQQYLFYFKTVEQAKTSYKKSEE